MRPDGRLRITDRKKELIKTSGGKTIAPQPIELSLKSIRGVSQAVLIGDRRHYITALLTLDPENAPLVAAELGISDGASLKALAQHTRIRDYLEESIAQEVNANLARHETIKRFSVLASELSLSDGELTPTLKLRRKAIHARYAAQIDALYEQ
jgi:long-chain acyl-CoA synthetase